MLRVNDKNINIPDVLMIYKNGRSTKLITIKFVESFSFQFHLQLLVLFLKFNSKDLINAQNDFIRFLPGYNIVI